MSQLKVQSLLERYDKSLVVEIKKLNFKGIDNKDVYNVTAPFAFNEKEYIAGRVESRESETSQVRFFYRRGNEFFLDESAPIFDLQDPFITFFDTELVFGGVHVGGGFYKTLFYRGKDIYSLKKFAEGPTGMKDIRLIKLSEGKIGLFTRPQGKTGGRGRIGFLTLNSLDELTELNSENYFSAELIPGDFSDEEWIGANAIYPLKTECIGILGHIACLSGAEKNYYPVVFNFHPEKKTFLDTKIIAARKDFPVGQSKKQELQNVLFGGGLIRQEDGTAKLYVGAGDAEAYELILKDPFLEFEAMPPVPIAQ